MKARIKAFLNRHPRLKQWARALLHALRGGGSSVSSGYVEMKGAEADHEAARLRASWQNDDLPARQRQLVDQQLADYRRGAPIDVFDVMVDCIRSLPAGAHALSVLEVGCSSGHYAEVFDIAKLPVVYAGCDYSDAFIALARKTYPSLQFDVEDATALSYQRDGFDVVISGCCILHIPEYEAAVAETARVARRFAIFHRTPMVLGEPNKYFRKQAYGVETVEIHFNEPGFLELLRRNGLRLMKTHTLSESLDAHGAGSAVRTYLCEKIAS